MTYVDWHDELEQLSRHREERQLSPCPPWCRKPTGHLYCPCGDSDVRVHSSVADSDDRVGVAVVQTETNHDGVITRDPPTLWLHAGDGLVEGLSRDEAARLIAALSDAERVIDTADEVDRRGSRSGGRPRLHPMRRAGFVRQPYRP